MYYTIYLSSAKQQALILGDTSNTVVHPFFVHFAHLAGCQFYQQLQGRFNLSHVEATHQKLTLTSLTSMNEEDLLSLAQANIWMGLGCIYRRLFRQAKPYMKTSLQIIRKNIRFFGGDTTTRQEKSMISPVPPEEVHERVVFLSQVLYIEAAVYLIGQPGATGFVLPEAMLPDFLVCAIYPIFLHAIN
jgi:hypothetical protein